MATDSRVLAWRMPMDRGAWGGYRPWGHKELDTTEQLSLSPYLLSQTFLTIINRWGDSANSGWLYIGGLQNHCRW